MNLPLEEQNESYPFLHVLRRMHEIKVILMEMHLELGQFSVHKMDRFGQLHEGISAFAPWTFT
jgi:hypothetical protein